MNIYKKEMKRNIRSALIWTIAMSLLNLLQMAVYPSVAQQTKSLEELLSKMPKGLIAAFGMDKLSMTEVLGYYGTKSYPLLLLLGGIFSILLFTSVFVREKDERTIEFLLSKPITMNQMITEKLAASLTLVFLFNAIVSAVTYLSIEAYRSGKEYDLTVFLLLCAGSFILDVIFGALGAFLSPFFSRGKTAMSLAIGVILISYFISILSSTSDKYHDLRYVSPFSFVESVDIILNKRLNPTYMIISAVSVLIFMILTYTIYNRRDIAS